MAAEIVPDGFGPPGDDVHHIGSFEPLSPAGQPFHDPFYNPPNTFHHQPQPSPRMFERYNDDIDLGPRISNLDINDTTRDFSQKRSSSPFIRKSILKPRSSSVGKKLPVYEYHRLEKSGDDWNVADVYPILASEKDIEEKVRNGRKRSVLVSDQMANMRPARRGQINRLLDELNSREKETGARWDPVYIHDKDVAINKSRTRRDIRTMDVIFQRTTQSRRPTQWKSRLESYAGRTVDLREANKSKEKDKKDGKDKDKGGDGKSKSTMKDTDLFGTSRLFSSDGKPIDEHGAIPFENGGLPPHIPKDLPIGRRLPGRSKSRDQNFARQSALFGEAMGNQPGVEMIPPPPMGGPLDQSFDMAGILNNHEPPMREPPMREPPMREPPMREPPMRGRRDSGVDVRPQRGSLSRRRSALRQQTRSRSRPRSKSRPRVVYTNDARAADYLNHHFHSNSSVSSGDLSVLRGDIDEVSTNTSDSHNDYPPRNWSHRRSSSKYEQQPFIREHYRGPSIPTSPTRNTRGEQITIAERRPTMSGRQRPLSYIQTSQPPLTRAITYGGHDRSPERMSLTPLSPLSPRRGGREVELYHYNDLERDREREANRYMSDAVLREQELKDREYRVQRAEMELEAREREREIQRRRERGYFAPGGYNTNLGYDGYDTGYGGRDNGRDYRYGDGRYRQ